jgi:hypothetical protein
MQLQSLLKREFLIILPFIFKEASPSLKVTKRHVKKLLKDFKSLTTSL